MPCVITTLLAKGSTIHGCRLRADPTYRMVKPECLTSQPSIDLTCLHACVAWQHALLSSTHAHYPAFYIILYT